METADLSEHGTQRLEMKGGWGGAADAWESRLKETHLPEHLWEEYTAALFTEWYSPAIVNKRKVSISSVASG